MNAPSSPAVLLEICCGSLTDALHAAEGGADRVELCSALFLGGLTPSMGTMLEAERLLGIPFVAMVRPRGGGFRYNAAELAAMETDVELAVDAGAAGVVLGVLTDDGRVDAKRLRRLVARAGDADVVFHRAFDVTPDPFAALETLVDAGVTRILTSGQQPDVPRGAALIRELIEAADGRIEILPGGGIAAWNLYDCIARTGCDQVHLTAFGPATDPSTRGRPAVTFGGMLRPAEDVYEETDADLVRQIKGRLGG